MSKIKNNPLISVIVPIFGIERYIGVCIESLLKQSYKNLEIILVDDGSPDRSPEICDLYKTKDSRIKVIHKTNGGLVSARKAGIMIATGDYVTYVDGDDWIGPEFYEKMVQVLDDADVVCGGQSRVLFDSKAIIENNIPIGVYEGSDLDFIFSNMISFGEFYKTGITTYVWNKLFKRELLLKYQLMVDDGISIGEDAAVVYPLFLECKKIVICNNCDYFYRQREDSMLKKSKPFINEVSGLKKLYEYLSSFAKEYEKYNLLKQVQDYVLGICIMRSGGLYNANLIKSPFRVDFKNKNILIYSAGTFGQQLVNRIKEHEYCNIVSWIDEDYWEYRRCCLNVDSIDEIEKCKFDYILIATVDTLLANIIKNKLIDRGVLGNKIVTIEVDENIREPMINKYLGV